MRKWAKDLQGEARKHSLAWHNAAAPVLNYRRFDGAAAAGLSGWVATIILSLNK